MSSELQRFTVPVIVRPKRRLGIFVLIDLGVIGAQKLVVLSDLHIGDPRTPDLTLSRIYGVIRDEKPAFLVLAGDILEGNLATESQVYQLRNVCHAATRVVMVIGNHDGAPTQDLARSLHCPLDLRIAGTSGCRSFVIEHGHRFDRWWKRVPGLGGLGIWFNRILYRCTRFDLQEWTRRFGWVQRGLRRQHARARAFWKTNDIVVTGHTHLPTNNPSVGYFNSGDWLVHRSYVVLHNGAAELKELP